MEEELDNVTLTAKKPTEKNRKKSVATVAKLKKIAANKKDKEARLNRRADKIAARRGVEGSGVFNEDGNPDNESLMKARKVGRDVISKRKEARKQYLRNFASQLARGEQAAPRIAFGEGEDGKPTTTSSLVGAQKEIDAKNEQASQDKRNILNSVDTFKVPNASLGLTSIDMVGQNFGKDFMGQIEVPDLTPIKYMQKEYRKKRGY
jgi:hypothetical protein